MIMLLLDYLASARKIFACFDLGDHFQPGEFVMGFMKFTSGTSLCDKDRKALQELLGAD